MVDLSNEIAGLSPKKRELLLRLLKHGQKEPDRTSQIPRRSSEARERFPLSFAQERLWFLDQLESGSSFYNSGTNLRLSGPLDFVALEHGLGQILRRHEALRSSFTEVDGRPLQVVSPSADWRLPLIDLRAAGEELREDLGLQLVAFLHQLPFDLGRGPLFRATLLRLSDAEHLLCLNLHHIVFDGWSVGVLIAELVALYRATVRGEASPLPDLPIQYGDFALWQRRWLTGERLEDQLGFWRRQLAGVPLLELPTDRPRPSVQRFRGALYPLSFPPKLLERLKAMGEGSGATPFMILLAAFQILLSRYARQDDLAVGSPVANRNREELEGLIGFFANSLVLRADLSGAPGFREVLGRVRRTAIDAFAHQDLPFEKLVAELQPERSLARNPLFQVLFALQNARPAPTEMAGVALSFLPLEVETSLFDLALSLSEKAGGVDGFFRYDSDLFDPATLGRLARNLGSLLEGSAEDPERPVGALPLLAYPERHQVVIEWNESSLVPSRPPCVHRLVEAQAVRSPQAPALVWGDLELSYAELNQRANRLAHYLRRLGVGREVPVALCMERGAEAALAILAVLKAGGLYVPLDPTYPRERLAYMLESVGAPVLLTQRRLAELLPETGAVAVCLDALDPDLDSQPCDDSQDGPVADNLAYVIYTSGSTGRPKGVALTHRVLSSLVLWQRASSAARAEARTLQFASLSFDVSFQEIFSTWCAGGALVVVPEDLRRDPDGLVDFLAEHRIERFFLPFVALQQMAEAANRREELELSLREVITAGEQLQTTPQLRRFFSCWAGCSLENQYGPSESHVVTAFRLSGAAGLWPLLPPIGRPIPGAAIRLLDSGLEPVPIGVPGGLYIGGSVLARGYFGRPELTAERFLPDPFGPPGSRLYRTGDLARLLPAGDVEFLGRDDFQIKVRGYRIEPGEIETALCRHPAIREAVVVAAADRSGGKRLVAYCRAHEGPLPDPGPLRHFLLAALPDYMVPSLFVALDSLPLTPSGKLDRRALPEPDWSRTGPESDLAADWTPVEEIIAQSWAQILGRERVGLHDGFFDLGGHSLLATQAMSRLRDAFGVHLPLRTLFERPTVARLAEAVEAAKRGLPAPVMDPGPRDGELPLSFAQQRLWFFDQFRQGSSLYNFPAAFRIAGSLDVEALERSVNHVVARHESLRTRFPTKEGRPVQAVAEDLVVPLRVVDLSALGPPASEAAARRLAREEIRRPFSLEQGPLLRALLVRLAEEEHLFLLCFHHIVADGWSMAVLCRELGHFYAASLSGTPAALPPLPLQYPDFARWQRGWLRGDVLEEQMAYWRCQLEALPDLELPADRPRPPAQTFRGGVRSRRLSAPLAAGLKGFARQRGATLFMTLLTGLDALLYRYTGQDDLAVGTTIANRNRTEIEPLIGFFVNTLVLRVDLSQSPTATELLARIREVTLAAYLHQDLPFELIVGELQPDRDLSRNPLFQVMLTVANAPLRPLSLEGLTVEPEELPHGGTAKFDLLWAVEESPEGLRIAVGYGTDLFDAGTVLRMLDHFEGVLSRIVADPGARLAELSILSEAERHHVLQEWNDTRTEVPRESGLAELFAVQAVRTPEAVALRFGEETLSYGELERRGNRLARYLRGAGVGLETTVGLFLERSAQMVVAMLGIVKAGGAYVPLDLSYPRERLAFMLVDSGAPLVLTRSSLAEDLPTTSARKVLLDADEEAISEESAEGLPWEAGADHLAYVIYTSGSTGQPKGVAVIQRAIARLVLETDYVQLGPADRVAQASNASFDAATFEIWGALLNGACLVGIAKETALSPSDLARELAARRITTLFLTTSLFNQLASEAPEGFGSLHHLLFGGEAADPAKVRRVLERGAPRRLLHVYGPTESTTYASWYEVAAVPAEATTVPIGSPLSNTTLFVLDREHGLVPVGVPGELCIGGEGLARGYFGRPELTAEKFIPQPVGGAPGSRLYRTGDRVRRLPDGNLEFLGRIDHQVKLRGFRIELGEIESALRQHAGVEEAVVLVWAPEPGHRRLVAYLQPVAGSATEDLVASVRGHLGSHLPEFMVPSAFVVLPSLPLTPNGKLDRRALPEPERERPRDEDFVAPRTGVETTLAGIWSSVLGVGTVGVHDNFFDLGGDSILSIQIVARANLAGLRLAPHQLFEHQTVAELALVAGMVQVAEAEQGPVLGEVALTPIQRWWLEQEPAEPHHFNQAFLLEPVRPLRPALLERAWAELLVHHDALRLRLVRDPQGWRQSLAGPGDPVPLLGLDLSGLPGEAGPRALASAAAALQASLDLERGPVCRLGLFALPNGGQRLLVVVHHLAVDGVSWRILLEDLERVYGQLEQGGPVRLPGKTTSFQRWARLLEEYGGSAKPGEELPYWSAVGSSGSLPLDGKDGDGGAGAVATVTGWLEEERTRELLQEVGQAYNTQIQEVLLAALLETFDRWTGERRLRVDLEGHGREELFEGVDLSRTVGWFTSMFPVLLEAWEPDPGEVLKSVKEQMRRVPGRGIGYGLLRYLGGESEAELLRGQAPAEVSFNYLGQFDQTFSASSFVRRAAEPVGPVQGPTWRSPHRLDVVAGVLGGRLQVSWIYTAGLFRRETVECLCRDFLDALRDLVDHCLSPEAGGYTPSDFPLASLGSQQLDMILDKLGESEARGSDE